MRPEGWTIVVVIVIALLLFGAPKLPGLARSVGQSLRIFKSEVKQMKDENNTENGTQEPPVEGKIVDPPRRTDAGQPGTPQSRGTTPPGPGNSSTPAP